MIIKGCDVPFKVWHNFIQSQLSLDERHLPWSQWLVNANEELLRYNAELIDTHIVDDYVKISFDSEESYLMFILRWS